MEIKIINKKDIKPSVWGGGKTYELFIYPPNAKYADHNFDLRISTATIEKVPSVFTKFEGYFRYLLMLDNELKINHNYTPKAYKKLELFRFRSSDEIVSFSKGNDFNLMVKDKNQEINISTAPLNSVQKSKFGFLYTLTSTQIRINDDSYNLEKDTCVTIINHRSENFRLFSEQVVIFGSWG